MCAKRICDLSNSFEIIHQKACRSYDEQDSSQVQFYDPLKLNIPPYQSSKHTLTIVPGH
jgi:hypothetical protein